MKPVCSIVVSLVVCWGLAGTAQAAGPTAAAGEIPPAMMQDLGLSGFQPMSDAQALQVRGKAVSTSGSVHIGPFSFNGFTFHPTPNSSVTVVGVAFGPIVAGGFSAASVH